MNCQKSNHLHNTPKQEITFLQLSHPHQLSIPTVVKREKRQHILMRKANRFVLEYIRERHLPENRNYQVLSQQVNAQARERNALIEVRIQSLGAELDKLKQRLENAKNAILDNTPLKDEILEDIPTLREHKQNLQAKIEELQQQCSLMVSPEYLRKRDMRIIQGLEGDLEAKRKVVHMLIKRVLVYRSGYLEVVPRKELRNNEESFTELVQK